MKIKPFLIFLAKIIDKIAEDQYLGQHKKFFVKEMRLVIYSQFLESYKTVTLENMALAFGVSAQFIDKYDICGENSITSVLGKSVSSLPQEDLLARLIRLLDLLSLKKLIRETICTRLE